MRALVTVMVLAACSTEGARGGGDSSEYDIATEVDAGYSQGSRLAVEAKVEIVEPSASARAAAVAHAIDRGAIEMARIAARQTPVATADDFARETLATFTTIDEQLAGLASPEDTPVSLAIVADAQVVVPSDEDAGYAYLRAQVRFFEEADVVIGAAATMIDDEELATFLVTTRGTIENARIDASNRLRTY
jgi:hypothetical protein